MPTKTRGLVIDDEVTVDSKPEELPELTGELLAQLWSDYKMQKSYRSGRYRRYEQREAFALYLTPQVDSESIENLEWCGYCEEPSVSDDLCGVSGGDRVCTPCLDDQYFYCERCEEHDHNDNRVWIENEDSSYCDSCVGRYYTYCENCEDYWPDSNNHNCENSCECEAPRQSFSIRNDGDAPLENDTRATITLPVGVIDDEGLRQIEYLLRWDANLAGPLVRSVVNKLDRNWVTKQGNFTKRLSKALFQEHGVKLPANIVSQVGVIAKNFSATTNMLDIEITRDLNLSPEDFFHSDSCWWGSYSSSRCALKSNGGFGMRSFYRDEDAMGEVISSNTVTGRAWVMPLKKDEHGNLVPTFDTAMAVAFVIFNGYGDLDGYKPARIMAHMAGMTYKKIEFDATPMYVNSGGYLVAPQEILDDITSISLNLQEHSNLAAIEETFSRALEEKKVLVSA